MTIKFILIRDLLSSYYQVIINVLVINAVTRFVPCQVINDLLSDKETLSLRTDLLII